ncbi:hypothetical protein M413DRAFT_6026 [Hebeloma cylindrosporum]|uniref:Uncharacterized protein n=1 Tax=Hebeloma cylindrosporum TaxID=76867 RepID=A0A0C3CXW1_HEBCY|nr:hypothetical protein M413DRAFT_6026 [Hebeloma cylindrosporum h7]
MRQRRIALFVVQVPGWTMIAATTWSEIMLTPCKQLSVPCGWARVLKIGWQNDAGFVKQAMCSNSLQRDKPVRKRIDTLRKLRLGRSEVRASQAEWLSGDQNCVKLADVGFMSSWKQVQKRHQFKFNHGVKIKALTIYEIRVALGSSGNKEEPAAKAQTPACEQTKGEYFAGITQFSALWVELTVEHAPEAPSTSTTHPSINGLNVLSNSSDDQREEKTMWTAREIGEFDFPEQEIPRVGGETAIASP